VDSAQRQEKGIWKFKEAWDLLGSENSRSDPPAEETGDIHDR